MRKAAVALWLLCVACGDGGLPVQPQAPRPADPSPAAPPPNGSAVVGIELAGPESIDPGQSAQFTATVRLRDGSTQRDANLLWVFSNSLVRVDGSGLATAGNENGEGIIRARLNLSTGGFIDGAQTVLVLARGTYRVAGRITEQDFSNAPIVGARVELTTDPRVSAMTDADGRYRLYGVPDGGEVRVSRDGYQPSTQRLQITQHATHDVQLPLAGARLDLAGAYVLTVDVDCATSTPVRPPELRRRSYAAVIRQNGSRLDVVLTESSRFRVNSTGRGDRFTGRADAAGATFELQSFFSYFFPYDPSTYPDVLERVSDGTFLEIDGTAVTKKTATGLAGELHGFAAHYSSGFPTHPPGMNGGTLGTCYSPAHRFTLTRDGR